MTPTWKWKTHLSQIGLIPRFQNAEWLTKSFWMTSDVHNHCCRTYNNCSGASAEVTRYDIAVNLTHGCANSKCGRACYCCSSGLEVTSACWNVAAQERFTWLFKREIPFLELRFVSSLDVLRFFETKIVWNSNYSLGSILGCLQRSGWEARAEHTSAIRVPRDAFASQVFYSIVYYDIL